MRSSVEKQVIVGFGLSLFLLVIVGLAFYPNPIPVLAGSGLLALVLVGGAALILRHNAAERKRAEENVRKLTRAVEQSPTSIVITDITGTIEYVNPKFTQLTGYTSEQVIGKNPRILKSGETPPEEYKRLWQTIKSGGTWRGEFHNKKKNGELYWESASISPVFDAVGAITHFVAVKEDITQRKQAEAEMERQYREADHARSEMRAVLDAVGEAILLVAPDGRFLSVNQKVSALFGIGSEEILGRCFDELGMQIDLIFQDPAGFKSQVLETVADTEKQFTQTVLQRWPERRELELFSTPVRGTAGDYWGRLFVFRDVTHERQVDRMKTDFISLVSHELRTPLTSIKGFTDLILEGDAGEVREEQREYLSIVKQNADRLVSLINELLDISRIESGRVQLQLAPVRMQEVVDLVVASLSPQIQQKSQALHVRVAPELLPVLGDRDRLTQVLTNLLSNAHKYTPAGGSIRVEAKSQDNQVVVSVTDNGIGISPEDQKNLFTKFYRVDSSLTRQIGGTGLGLAIVKSIVELHGGAVSVESQPGQGSTFSFTMPVVTPAEPVPVEPPSATRGRTGRSILVVEDDAEIAQLIQIHLERAGFQVATAGTVEAALEQIRPRLPDLITLDIKLPGKDGLVLAEQLAQSPETNRIPILVISAFYNPSAGMGERGIQLNLVNALSKPIDRDQLINTVSRMLEQSQQRSILVADDDPATVELLGVAFRKRGLEVISAYDGKTALEVASAKRPGLILLDLRMPVMDGLAVLQSLKQNPMTAGLPVIVMTGSEGLKAGARARVLSLGAADFVTKPFDLHRLLDQVNALTRGGQG